MLVSNVPHPSAPEVALGSAGPSWAASKPTSHPIFGWMKKTQKPKFDEDRRNSELRDPQRSREKTYRYWPKVSHTDLTESHTLLEKKRKTAHNRE